MGGAFLGVERVLTERFSVQLGVSAYADCNLTPQGDVWLFSVPKFDALIYRYQVRHSRVMVEGKFLNNFLSHQAIHPYVSWEVGAAFNRACSYLETSFTPDVPPMVPFGNRSQSSFAYGVGLGVDYNLNQRVRFGIGYQFADLGAASLGLTSAELTTQTLSISHLYTNQLRFQLTFLI